MDNKEDLEYQRALEMLNSSKRSRQNKRKKEQAEVKKANDEANWDQMSFIEKCKADYVIPICLVLVVAVIIAASLYFILPMLKKDNTPNLGITYKQLQTKYTQTTIYNQSLKQQNFSIPDAKFYDIENGSIFSEVVSSDLPIGFVIEGAVRESDGKLTQVDVYMGYNFSLSDETFELVYTSYFSSFLEVFYPDEPNLIGLVSYIVESNVYDKSYFIYEGYGLRRVALKDDNNKTYLGIEILPQEKAEEFNNNLLEQTATT